MLEVQFGNPDEGIALIRRTIEIDPTSVGAHYMLALALAARSQFAEAYDAMAKAMAMHPEPGPPGPWFMQMSEICMALGRDAEAQQYASVGEQLMQQQPQP
jgi:cytochrome c-type biogenesis protein CcmH/NrfG